MASFYSSVRSYLRETLLTTNGLPAVQWEGRDFTPIDGDPYIREQLVPVDAPIETWGRAGQVSENFIYRISVFWPLQNPAGETATLFEQEDLVDTIRSTFSPGTTIQNQEGTSFGVVSQCDRGAMITKSDWRMVDINVFGYFRREAAA